MLDIWGGQLYNMIVRLIREKKKRKFKLLKNFKKLKKVLDKIRN